MSANPPVRCARPAGVTETGTETTRSTPAGPTRGWPALCLVMRGGGYEIRTREGG
jgi:hypothetical protein